MRRMGKMWCSRERWNFGALLEGGVVGNKVTEAMAGRRLSWWRCLGGARVDGRGDRTLDSQDG